MAAKSTYLLQNILSQITIVDYLNRRGYTLKKDGRRYRVEPHSSFVVDPAKNKFYWNSRNISGSVIDLHMYLENIDKKTAMHQLAKMLWIDTSYKSMAVYSAAPKTEEEPQPFELPQANSKGWQVIFAYLTKTRALNLSVINWLKENNIIYPARYKNDAAKPINLCYIGHSYDGAASFAALKGCSTYKPFKLVVPGSDMQCCFSVNLTNKSCSKLFITEAAIDSLSIMSMLADAGSDWLSYSYLSTESCNNHSAVIYHLEENEQIDTIYLCQDADTAGIKARSAIKELLLAYGYKGRVVDKMPPAPYKDWNEYRQNQAQNIKIS